MNRESSRNEDFEINIIRMLLDCLLQWRKILVAGIFLCILLAGFKVVKFYAVDSKNAVKHDEKIQIIKNLMDSEDDVPAALFADGWSVNAATLALRTEQVIAYEERYESKKDYLLTSPIMKFDSNSVPQINLSYYIDNGYTVIYPEIEKTNTMGVIQATYSDKLTNSEFSKEFCTFAGIEEEYFGEIYADNVTNGVIKIRISFYDEDSIWTLADMVQEYVQECYKAINQEYEHTLTAGDCYLRKVINSDYEQKYKGTVDELSSINASILKITDAMTADELLYLEAKKDVLGLLVKEEKETVFYWTSAAKWGILGGVAGAFLVFCWYLAVYLFTGKLKDYAYLENAYGFEILSHLYVRKKKTCKLDSWLMNLRDAGRKQADCAKDTEYLAVQLKSLIGKEANAKALICATDVDIESMKVIQSIASRVGKQVEVISDSLTSSPDALTKALACQSVILCMVMNKTQKREIRKQYEICSRNKIDILGCIVIE